MALKRGQPIFWYSFIKRWDLCPFSLNQGSVTAWPVECSESHTVLIPVPGLEKLATFAFPRLGCLFLDRSSHAMRKPKLPARQPSGSIQCTGLAELPDCGQLQPVSHE